ncbi:hypothetical protein AB0E01_35205 [Nocardia vinacea]|uniref:hypothetical protein n=1 Tax=Nocardia vinacea TaxID=96468 RepID=UPI0033DCF4C8
MIRRTAHMLASVGMCCAAMGVLAPQAIAADLAPGVHCDGLACDNDNDEAYVVFGTFTCVTTIWPPNGAAPEYFYENTPITQDIEPHSAVTILLRCGSGGAVVGWGLTSAVPRASLPQTGSAGS